MTGIVNSWMTEHGFNRRRKCLACDTRFNTIETTTQMSRAVTRVARDRRNKLVGMLKRITSYADEAAKALESQDMDIEGTGTSGQASGRRQSPSSGNGGGLKEAP